MPDAAALAALRRDIDRRPQRLKTVLSAGGIRKEFLGGVAKDEAKVVKRFVDEHTESSLKTKPKVSDFTLALALTLRESLLETDLLPEQRPCCRVRTNSCASKSGSSIVYDRCNEFNTSIEDNLEGEMLDEGGWHRAKSPIRRW
jgi:hypothetical protein